MLFLKKQGGLRFFTNLKHQTLLHHHQFTEAMAAHLYNHGSYKGFQGRAQWPPSHFSRDHSCKYATFPGKIRNTRNTRLGRNFFVKGCFKSQHHHHQSHSSSIKRHSNAFENPNAQLVHDLELDLRSSDAIGLASSNGCQERGSHTGIPPHSLPDDKIVVAVDVDEVLGNFVSALNRFIADRYSSHHSVSEYHVYEFFKIWNCSRDEADIRVHEFFKTSYFKTGIHPLPGAQETIHKLSGFCDLSVVTSRQNAIKDHTIQWIEKHFPGLFQEIHFGNHFALDGESRPKSEICRSLGAKVLIDDNPRYALECAEAGIRVLLFDYENSYPWCKTESIIQHPLVTKVHNWEAVEKHLMTWIIS
ncbi:PREDICTED: uncharacterized protein LOC103340500 [Prunus mume]|uniref:Uncharacterized protein LOC103340500 n=1 Tax=Prunus mume TaxID=102107 RepID=A0ABM0PNH6_PRUMU|nr:PREDICTED: uncharacterized protein LOC103340500 [Prunus mume]XP_008242141.1 PREDICTED: uncharacterized protein LOC103340500 [Prunus mume]